MFNGVQVTHPTHTRINGGRRKSVQKITGTASKYKGGGVESQKI